MNFLFPFTHGLITWTHHHNNVKTDLGTYPCCFPVMFLLYENHSSLFQKMTSSLTRVWEVRSTKGKRILRADMICFSIGIMIWTFAPRGDTKHISIRGGQSKRLSGNPKISLQHHCNPKISANFILRNLYMNIKYPETMQTKVKIVSSEPRNIS